MKLRKIKYVTLSLVLEKHDIIIRDSGGLSGIKDLGIIDSVLEHIKNDIYYLTFEDKLTHLIFSFIKNHAFNDGNKRTSIAVGNIFLRLNKFDNCIDVFTKVLEEVVVAVAQNAIDKDGLRRIVSAILQMELMPKKP
jgi:death on curing protein